MQIGPIQLPNQVALAPMAGVTDLPFRRLCRRLGAGYVVGEMLASNPSLRHTSKSRLRGVHLGEPIPRAIQIVGWDPATMADAARYNVDQGASVIDINMGCPAKKVNRKAAGSALLADEDLVARILEAVVSAVDVPVTLKMRTGIDPSCRNGARIARIAESSGISALAVHGRTRACRYQGQAEFETVRDICREVRLPVYANGEVTDCIQAADILKKTGAAGIMIGRGAHGAPWLPGRIAEYLGSGIIPPAPDLDFQAGIVREHLDAIYTFYGSGQGVRIARKHIKWYLDPLPDSGPTRTAAFRTDCPRAQLALLSDYYQNLQDTRSEASVWQNTNPGKPARKTRTRAASSRNVFTSPSAATCGT